MFHAPMGRFQLESKLKFIFMLTKSEPTQNVCRFESLLQQHKLNSRSNNKTSPEDGIYPTPETLCKKNQRVYLIQRIHITKVPCRCIVCSVAKSIY